MPTNRAKELTLRLHVLIQLQRDAVEAVIPQQGTRGKGANTRALWSPVLSEVERERKLLTTAIRAVRKYIKGGKQEELELAEETMLAWEVE